MIETKDPTSEGIWSLVRRFSFVGLLTVSIFLFSGAIARADIENEWEWSGPGLGGSSWAKEADSGLWSTLPLGDSPFAYSYETVCFDDSGVAFIDCLNANECVAAPDGLYVVWKRSPRSIVPPVWDDFPNNGPTCVYSENPDALLEEIRTVILEAFHQAPVKAGSIFPQPGQYTLLNMETNFRVASEEQVFNARMLGQDIIIRARPTEYVYYYGDGNTLGPTTLSGIELPIERTGESTATSHVYTTTGEFRIYATVYFTAEYSLNGGPMIPIDGRGSFDTPVETISVWKSESRNVADNCLVNPAGFGC